MELPPILDEATKRSGVVWVAFCEHPPVPAWHVWHADRLWLVCGGLEQDLPGARGATSAVVTVRSKATQNDRLIAWIASVAAVEPLSPEWDEVVPLLHATRLNAPDGEDQPHRWARDSLVLCLTPTGELIGATTDPELAPPRRPAPPFGRVRPEPSDAASVPGGPPALRTPTGGQ